MTEAVSVPRKAAPGHPEVATGVRKADTSRNYQYPESLSVKLVPVKQGGLADVRVQHVCVVTLVQRTDQGSMVRLQRRLARLDARCVRLHRLPLHHRADRR